MSVEALTSFILPRLLAFEPDEFDKAELKITRIFELVDDGVIEAVNPVTSTYEVEVVVNRVEVLALTTCNTLPAGKPVVVALVNTVPELSGKFSVRSVFEFGLASVNVPVPEALPDNAILLMLRLPCAVQFRPVRLGMQRQLRQSMPLERLLARWRVGL